MLRENFTENHLRWNDFKSCKKPEKSQKKTWMKSRRNKKKHDKNAKEHDFSMSQKVWYLETNFLGKNKNLAPK